MAALASSLSLSDCFFSDFPSWYWAESSPQAVALVWKNASENESKNNDTPPLFPFLNGEIRWAQWQQLLNAAQHWLATFGVKPHSLIAYQGSHRLAGLLTYCAVLASGAKILPLNPAMPDSQRQACLATHGVDLLITDQHFANFPENFTACSPFAAPEFHSNHPATLTLTSGSTGSPKAVVHSIAQHLANAEGVCELMDFKPPACWLLSLPLFHVSGQGIIWRWLASGATLQIVENKSDFTQALAEVSHASLVPTQLQRYLAERDKIAQLSKNTAKNHRLSQRILLGGAYLPPDLLAQAANAGIETYAGYGLTEMASTVCAAKMSDPTAACDHLGTPLKNRAVRIEQGEIWVQGAGLALGYWLNGQIVPLTNAQGWFATKDKGSWNARGQLQIAGRLDNMFISGGENIQPEQVEKVLLQSGLLQQVVVVPVADAEFGERPVAVVEFCAPFSLQAVALLRQFADQQLEKFKRPIAYLPFPAQHDGGIKIARKALQQQVAEAFQTKQ